MCRVLLRDGRGIEEVVADHEFCHDWAHCGEGCCGSCPHCGGPPEDTHR